MCFISLFGSLYFVISNNKNENSTEYLETEDMNGAAEFFINFFSWILNLSNLVPISLLVTLELVKMTQGIFITKDPGMIYL
jgi:phospholipid-transporting ATPase